MPFLKSDQVGVKKKKRKGGKSDRKKLIERLDDAMRDYIKTLPDTCCCCGKKNFGFFSPRENPYGIQVGHFVGRSAYALRWDKRNCNPQCSSCNYIHKHNVIPYTRFMRARYGENIFDEFEKILREHKPFKKSDLETILSQLTTI